MLRAVELGVPDRDLPITFAHPLASIEPVQRKSVRSL